MASPSVIGRRAIGSSASDSAGAAELNLFCIVVADPLSSSVVVIFPLALRKESSAAIRDRCAAAVVEPTGTFGIDVDDAPVIVELFEAAMAARKAAAGFDEASFGVPREGS